MRGMDSPGPVELEHAKSKSYHAFYSSLRVSLIEHPFPLSLFGFLFFIFANPKVPSCVPVYFLGPVQTVLC